MRNEERKEEGGGRADCRPRRGEKVVDSSVIYIVEDLG